MTDSQIPGTLRISGDVLGPLWGCVIVTFA